MTAEESEPKSTASASRTGEYFLLTAIFLLVAAFDLWTVRSTGTEWRFGREQEDYYNRLIDGWLDGHLYMKAEVSPALLAVSDPYDPRQRPQGSAMHDATLYQGRYYIYFGVGPVVTLLLPFRLVTGVDLPLPVAVLVFVYGGFVASAAVWLGIRRRLFPRAGPVTAALGVLALGSVSLGPMLLRRPEMWELPIAAGCCFAMLTLWCVWRSLQTGARRVAWFAASGLCLGLAIASRPTYLFATPLLLAPLVAWWLAERRAPWRPVLGAAIPLMVIGAGMALHNYLRFGNPLEFGHKYQLTYFDERNMPHFSPRYLGFNAWRYFFSAAQWREYFPFIRPADMPPKPPGFSGHDDVFGLVTNLPFVCLVLLAPLAWWRRSAEERAMLRAWLGSAVILFLGLAAVLNGFFGSLARYQLDFTPTLVLLAAVGLLALEEALRDPVARGWRWAARAVWVPLLVYSVGFGVLYSLQLDSLLLERNPRMFRAVARQLDGAWYLVGRVVRGRTGPIELTLRLAPQPRGTKQTFLATGYAPEENRIFLRYEDDGRMRLGYEGAAGAPRLSRPLTVDWSRTHRVRVGFGVLYPPETHPYFGEIAPEEIGAYSRRLRVEFDDEPVIDGFLRPIEATRGNMRVGARAAAGAGDTFAGEITDTRRTGPVFAHAPEPRGDFFRAWVEFAGVPETRSQVLLSAGAGEERGEIYLRALDDVRMVIGGRFGDAPRKESDEFAFARGATVPIVLRLDPAKTSTERAVSAWVDGTLVWSAAISWPAGTSPTLQGDNTGTEGRWIRVSGWQYAAGSDPLLRRGAIKLRVVLPQGRTDAREPLLVSGRVGEGDFLAVQYVDARHVQFLFDHWGAVLSTSAPVAIDYTQPHDIVIDLGFAHEPRDSLTETALRETDLVVQVDGQEVWRHRTPFYNVPREELALARNPIGGSTCGERFTGRVLGAEVVGAEGGAR